MIIVADSGSTKTTWKCCYKNSAQKVVKTIGMNPYNTGEQTLKQTIEETLLPNISAHPKEVSHLFFYGAGCFDPDKSLFMKDLMTLYFPGADIEIHHDLLGAARACCGNHRGIVGILGTGSNSCIFDGQNIIDDIPSLGYILCDEGAGTNIGKLLLSDYLRHRMPPEINNSFSFEYPWKTSEFLDRLYKGEQPNSFLASFALFASKYKGHQYIKEIVKTAFRSFFTEQISHYENYHSYVLNTVGSIGFHFAELLQETAWEKHMKLGKVIASPIDSLTEYHLNELKTPNIK